MQYEHCVQMFDGHCVSMLRVCMYYCRCRLHWVDGWMGIIIMLYSMNIVQMF